MDDRAPRFYDGVRAEAARTNISGGQAFHGEIDLGVDRGWLLVGVGILVVFAGLIGIALLPY